MDRIITIIEFCDNLVMKQLFTAISRFVVMPLLTEIMVGDSAPEWESIETRFAGVPKAGPIGSINYHDQENSLCR